jgi:hypothetical protein
MQCYFQMASSTLATSIRVGHETILPSFSIPDLGVCIDTELLMRTHVQRKYRAASQCSVHHSSANAGVPATDADRIARTIVSTRLRRRDVGGHTSAPATTFAVRTGCCREVNFWSFALGTNSSTLADLLWLRVTGSTNFTLAASTYRCFF